MTKIGIPDILKALRSIPVPTEMAEHAHASNIVDAGLIGQESLRINDATLSAIVALPPVLGAQTAKTLCQKIEETIQKLGVFERVNVLATAESPSPVPPAPERVAKRLIAVASGKGGVGKSTVAVNLALALAARGLKVGILDADIYGPSLPRLLGLEGFKPVRTDSVITPAEAFGLKAMSIGFMIPEDGPVVWRGPMVQNAILQMLRETRWEMPDVLLIDMPPGTGDAQIGLAQRAGLDGAVVVSTPQALALSDARKGLETFRKLNVPILGIVENMSVFVCPCCNTPTPIFGQNGARQEAARLGVAFLGALPIVPDLCALSDAGTPIVAARPESPAARLFHEIAENVLKTL